MGERAKQISFDTCRMEKQHADGFSAHVNCACGQQLHKQRDNPWLMRLQG